MSLQMKFVPFSPPKGVVQSLTQGIYTQNPPWHTTQNRLQMTSKYAGANAGNLSGDSILATARSLAALGNNGAVTAAGTLTINGTSLGSYDYITVAGTTVSSFTASDWFSATEDTRSAWVLVNGNLTINSGITFIPSVRKLFTVVYVTGNLVLNGTISMTGRGANHSGTGNSGGYTAPVDIRIGTGTFSAVVDPQIPAAGGAGGLTTGPVTGKNNGTAGTNGATGGGGSGYSFSSGVAGNGTAGTCFTGGGGGGGANGTTAGSAVTNGGKGGNAAGQACNGGTGNPGGNAGSGIFAEVGNDGTGGTLIVIVEGSASGTGSCVANGVIAKRLDSGRIPGGASGAGSVNVLYGTNPSGVTVTAAGGGGQSGGDGGNGTARKLAIGAN